MLISQNNNLLTVLDPKEIKVAMEDGPQVPLNTFNPTESPVNPNIAMLLVINHARRMEELSRSVDKRA